jgi:V8-like Glu-specific endopeptidase
MRRTNVYLATALMTVAILGTQRQESEAQQTAQQRPVSMSGRQEARAADVLAYWTAERLANARPHPLPRPTFAPAEDFTALEAGVRVVADGKPPTLSAPQGISKRLHDPSTSPAAMEAPDEELEPLNSGTAGAHFSSSRLVPLSADQSYPYRTVGKLFFTKPGIGQFVCSASVLRRRVVLTAGHCVHSGSGGSRGFYTDFLFVPAFRNGTAPYGVWPVAFVLASGTWTTGGGVFPNAADYAMFEMRDLVVNGVTRRIGDITGVLGFQTGSPRNHAHMLGYPVNLDNGTLMHQVTAGFFRLMIPNSMEYGSDMRGGSSGGPWIQNFGALAAGQVGGLNPGMNRVIGVTSYGSLSLDPKTAGASIPDSRFVQMLNTVCGRRVGNC